MKKLLSPLLITLVLMGCNKEPLTALNKSLVGVTDYGTVDARFCTQAPTPAKQNLKYLFIIDHSASNQPGFPSFAGDISNTDSQGSRRYGPLLNFLKNLVPDPNNLTSFAIIDFNDKATQPGTVSGFDSDTNNFINTTTTDWIGGGTAAVPAPFDAGFTNYQAALQMALTMIRKDAQNESAIQTPPIVTTAYQIIFVTDGVPTVASPSGSSNPTYTQTFQADLQPVIDSIMNIKSDLTLGAFIANITLNTAYYFNDVEVTSAESLLQQMAIEGNGQYLQFGSGKNILYQQFAPPSRNIRNRLVDAFVENENAVWWDDGRLMLDSDGDGLPDLIEQQFGSDPYNKDSDGNGVSDLVEYRTKGKPCNDAQCAAAGRDLYAICDGFSPVKDANGNVTFSSSTNDGLNDCEKFLLNASRTVFNTNGDMIPDFLALKTTLPVIIGSASAALADPFGDGITNYSKLKLGMPIQISNRTLSPDFQARATSLDLESSPSADVDCYHMVVENVALTSYSNTIKVMVIQNSSAVDDKPFLQVAERPFSGGQTSVSFLPGDFK